MPHMPSACFAEGIHAADRSFADSRARLSWYQ